NRLLKTERGSVKKDWKGVGSPMADQMVEQYVRPGDRVCIVGTYSAAENGLAPKYTYQFGAKRRDFDSTAGPGVIAIILLICLINGLFCGGVFLYQHTKTRDTFDLNIAIENNERAEILRLIK